MARRVEWMVVALVLVMSGDGGLFAAADEELPSPSELDLEAAPEPMRLSMDFRDANLKDVLKTFSQQTGINVIVGGEVGDRPITLYLENVTVLDAFDQILRVSDLTYERGIESDIYIVKPKPAAEVVATITRVYLLKYARVSATNLAKAAAAFGASTPFEAAQGFQQTTGAGGATTGTTASTTAATTPAAATATEEGGVGIDEVLKPLLTEDGSIVVDSRTNRLIITDIPENFPRLEAALAVLDVRTPQILVDAEIIETSLSKVKDLGIEWGTGSEGDLITFNPGSAGRSTRFPFGFLGRHAPSGPTAFPTNTLSFGSFDGVLQALESDTDTKILARPKILTLDNESAVIRLTTDEAIGFTTTTGDLTSTTTSEPERSITGVLLVVTPQVNADGYITMLVEPSVSKTVASKISPPSGQSTPRDPKTRSSRTLVRIRNGDTLVVGGLIDRSDEETLRRVPILSGIPFLGEAFKNTETSDSSSELLVFVTPRVLEEPSEAQLAAHGQTPLGLREQEVGRGREDTIEQTLNELEQSSRL